MVFTLDLQNKLPMALTNFPHQMGEFIIIPMPKKRFSFGSSLIFE
jgi:hypothetical protein